MAERARELRNCMTDAEQKLWYHLKHRQVGNEKFRRQHIVGPYIVDFVCLNKRVVVECDGGQHQEQKDYDEKRDAFLRDKGFVVLRFWNNDVLRNIDGVYSEIQKALK